MKLPKNNDLKEKSLFLRKNMTETERILWSKIKGNQINGINFDRQIIIDNYIVDFYCKKAKLVIEIDGISHKLKGEYDEQRHNKLISLGLYVIHINDIDIRTKLYEVLSFIQSAVEKIINGTAIDRKDISWNF